MAVVAIPADVKDICDLVVTGCVSRLDGVGVRGGFTAFYEKVKKVKADVAAVLV